MSEFLIISFYFPPFKRVGGRRWAKHVKYFHQLGLKPYVLAGDFVGQTSPWDKDITTYQKNIFRVPITPRLPYYKRKLPTNIFDKIVWKISAVYGQYKQKNAKKNFNDPSTKYEKLFLEKAIDIIRKKNISHLIISVGPFHYSAILIELKKKFPNLIISIDYRDPWEDGFKELSEKQISYEINLQKKVLETANHIITVNSEMAIYFSQKLKMKSVYILPHCYDADDIAKTKNISEKENDKIKFLYGGSFYPHLENYISVFLKLVHLLTEKNIFSTTNIYAPYSDYDALFKNSKINYTFNSYLTSENYFSEMGNADFLILFLPEVRKNAMSSKFFEMVAYQKPIVYFGASGSVSEFLIQHKLGFHITAENINEQSENIISNLKNSIIPDKNYDVTKFSFLHQTQLFLDFIAQKKE